MSWVLAFSEDRYAPQIVLW